MASLLSAVKSKAKRVSTTSTTTTNRGRLSSYSSEDSTNNNGDSSTTSSYNSSGNQSPIAMNNYQKLSSSTEEDEDINNMPSNNSINNSISKDNDDSTTLTPIQNVYNNPNRFIMTDEQQQQQVVTDDNVGGSVAKKRGNKAAQRHFNNSSTAKQQPSSSATKQKVRNNTNSSKISRGRNSNRRRGTNSKSPSNKQNDDDLILKTAVAIDNYVADSNCSPTGIEHIKQSTKKFGFKLFKEALSCYDDVTTPHDDNKLRSKGDDYFDDVEDDIDEISQKLFQDGNGELDSYAGTSVTSSNSFLDRAHPSVRGRSRKDRRLQELETRSVTSIHTTNTISSLNNLCGANIDLSILEEALDITSNEIENLQSRGMIQSLKSKSSKLKNVDRLLVCNGGGGCDMVVDIDEYDNEHEERVNRLKLLTKKFSKTKNNMKKSNIPVSKKDTPTKQKAAVEKNKGEEKKLDESLNFDMAVEKEKKELDKSLDWLDVEDVSFFDVGTNVFSGSGGLQEGEEVQL